ncbi:MAG: hypothetical protein GY941_16400 [Planctomycetes bacterium]|nr:hypothetical protein [Planctomycetota bacterium]
MTTGVSGNMSPDDILYETRDYRVVVGESTLTEQANFSARLYKAINKKYSVVEVETTVYPRIIEEVNFMQAAIDALDSEANIKQIPAQH